MTLYLGGFCLELGGSGVVVTSGVDMDFEDETENRVTLMVHNIRPPFLDGRVVFTTQMQIVSTVRCKACHPPSDCVHVCVHSGVCAPPGTLVVAWRLC